MFSQPPDREQPSKSIPNNPRRNRKHKISKKNKRVAKKDLTKRKNTRFSVTMSSWAECFTTAATWQLKHQVAYWKSKATALEYENRILHDIIKENYMNSCPRDAEFQNVESSVNSDSESEIEEETDDLEVSEEFIQFLKLNAKYKEDAKRERDLLKAKVKEEQQSIELSEELEMAESTESIEQKLKTLYGKDWQRIAALEMSLKCSFMAECDREKPMYWPNIPFNFNYN